ncbi:unnamed protein product [Durusdinium trenchii]|uniref:Protein arginine N-methyltransferase domain-containing protein n=1 Tax=Durusdinium trenchii TaxID=1381693 RepID=A0ABP0HTM8_9DINO
MLRLVDEDGQPAVIGLSRGLWLNLSDFVGEMKSLGKAEPTEGKQGSAEGSQLGFPRNWPAAYSSSSLKALIGKRGVLPGKRVAVAGGPSEEEKKVLKPLSFEARPFPQSFSNAQFIAKLQPGLSIVRGWVVWEWLDQEPGKFLAQRYWWNSHHDGRWVDFTPRPSGIDQLLLVEAEGERDKEPKELQVLSRAQAELTNQLLSRFAPEPHGPHSPCVKEQPAQKLQAKPQAKSQAKPQATPQAAKALDYSKWSNIVDSDEEQDEQGGFRDEDVGVKDLAEGPRGTAKKEPPIPDYLLGSTNGGGGTNCLTSLVKMLDSEQTQENAHQLAQVFGRTFHSAMLDKARQDFYKKALEAMKEVAKDAYVVILGIGSLLPMLRVAHSFSGVLLESSAKLADLAQQLLSSNQVGTHLKVAVVKALDDHEAVQEALQQHVPAGSCTVVVLTERMAHDLLSNGIVPCSLAVHEALRKLVPSARIRHIPQTVELLVAPAEIRSDRLKDFDIRPFNALRHTSSNDKADFWWWPVRMDNQQNTVCSVLGPSKTLCGFDFDRAPEIALDEVRRPLKLQASQRGRCNCAAVWWVAKFQDLEYSTRPLMAGRGVDQKDRAQQRSEWKQAIHYLAGETALFPGDVIELLVSITPRFTFRMMQQSPMSVEAPLWVQAPTNSKFSATLPILPYHFLMMTDLERLRVYQDALRDAIRNQSKKLGRRCRVLDAGCGIGLLGLSAALEGAEVWLCEAVPLMRHVCREVVAANAGLVAEKRGLVQLLPPMMSTRLHTEDVPKFDIVVSEVMDLWCLGEGIIPTMRHAHKKLLAEDGVMLPGKLQIYAQPLELSLWSEVEQKEQLELSMLTQQFKNKFSALRIDQFAHRFLTEEPILALEIDLSDVPPQPAEGEANIEGGVKLCIRMGGKPALRAKVSSTKIDHRGMLSGYGIWWSADLRNGHSVTSDPRNPQRSWKQLVRWLDQPRPVEQNEEIQVSWTDWQAPPGGGGASK